MDDREKTGIANSWLIQSIFGNGDKDDSSDHNPQPPSPLTDPPPDSWSDHD